VTGAASEVGEQGLDADEQHDGRDRGVVGERESSWNERRVNGAHGFPLAELNRSRMG
jgi:hypothetical protein